MPQGYLTSPSCKASIAPAAKPTTCRGASHPDLRKLLRVGPSLKRRGEKAAYTAPAALHHFRLKVLLPLKNFADKLQFVAITLWVGGLWAIGYIVAPSLFAHLDDRALAGMLAGKMFTLMAYIGLGCTYIS